MSPDPIGRVAADRIWKRFRADQPTRDLRDAYRRIRHRTGRGDWRWVLRDVSFELEPGGALALIGANGSGKSTMLKLLAGVMDPYAGRVELVGRAGALIEVRAGLHQDLTGRENIFLSGSLLGLPRKMVAERFDEMVHFADLEDAVDRQTKYYSTGMQMRLGFAVAAFLEPDVLLVDEVLAVGDATFQQRCLDRIRQVLAAGTTLVFVSHDLAAVEAMCNDAIWLRDGTIRARGSAHDVLGEYRKWVDESATGDVRVRGALELLAAEVSDASGGPYPRTQEALDLSITVRGDVSREATVLLGISEGTASPTLLVKRAVSLSPGETVAHCRIERVPLPRGRYYLWAGVFERNRDLLPWQPASAFDIIGPDLEWVPAGIVRLAPVHVESTWEIDQRS